MLGVTLLFWGLMTGRPFIGFFCAVLVELRHWIPVRWDFDEDDFGRAWQLTSIAVAIAAVMIWLDGNRFKALPGLISWLPPLLLPMQFVQTYGMRDSIQLGVFSFLAKKRRLRNERLGLIEEVVEVNFGNVFFVVAMVASSVGENANQWLFVPGLVALTGWRLAGVGRGRSRALIPAVAVCGILAVVGQFILERADDLIGRSYGGTRNRFSARSNSTMLGNPGKVDLPTEVYWRLKPAPGSPSPKLLRLGAYNRLSFDDVWQNQLPPEDFKPVRSKLIGLDSYYLLVPVDMASRIPKLQSFTLRGEAADESPLPVPGDTAGLRDLDLLDVERNTRGTIRISPRNAVIDEMVFWGSGDSTESVDRELDDLRIPSGETATSNIIHQSVADLRLNEEPSLDGKLKKIRTWFQNEFRYTTELTITKANRKRGGGEGLLTPIGMFLSKVRAGHCEYFASAAVLMLRDAGIPARYAVGYAVVELDPKRGEFVIRGNHAHAWCRVWDESKNQWIDFDPTPSNWLLGLKSTSDWKQRLNDRIKWIREDFFIWRNKPNNRLAVSLVMILIGLGLGAFIARRLWRSKRSVEKKALYFGYNGPAIRTPLNDLEDLAGRRLGPRPLGQPFSAWLGMLRPMLRDPRLLDDAIALHQRLRFDPEPAASEDHARLRELALGLEVEMKARTV